ncbi:PLP-dependent transferase [Sarocladium strictum]
MASGALMKSLTAVIDKRGKAGRLRFPPDPAKRAGVIDFGSNDTLSISSGVLRLALLDEIRQNPDFTVGATGSCILDGTTQYLVDLEASLAKYHHAVDAMYFNSGFEANVAIWTTLPQPGDIIVHDELIHASIHDGLKHTRARACLGFKHNDAESFRKVLQSIEDDYKDNANGTRSVFFALESVYSVDGDICPISDLLEASKEILPSADRIFVIDEAHSSGILGPQGSGLVCELGLEDEITIRLHTFGKAPGCAGAVVLCDTVIKLTLFNYARNYIFTTGPTFMNLAAVKAAYKILESPEGQQRRDRLQSIIPHFYACIERHPDWAEVKASGTFRLLKSSKYGSRVSKSLVPIVLLLTKQGICIQLADHLLHHGILVHAIHYPAVPLAAERLRIVLHADNTESEIDDLVDILINWAMKNRSEQGF